MEQPKRIDWSGRTDKGRYRKNNEDAFLAMRFDSREMQLLGKDGESEIGNHDYLFAVSDGMGGANAGEFASRITVDKVMQLLPRSFGYAAKGYHDAAFDLLPELFYEINSEILSLSHHYEECRGMGATLSMCWFGPRRMLFAHIGDSRIYYLPTNGKLMQLTRDDSRIWRLYQQGQLGLHQYRQHPERNILEKALGGSGSDPTPQVGVLEFEAGDQFILCSDGITDGLFDPRIESLMSAPPPHLKDRPIAERYIEEAKMSTSRDNVTAVWVKVT